MGNCPSIASTMNRARRSVASANCGKRSRADHPGIGGIKNKATAPAAGLKVMPLVRSDDHAAASGQLCPFTVDFKFQVSVQAPQYLEMVMHMAGR